MKHNNIETKEDLIKLVKKVGFVDSEILELIRKKFNWDLELIEKIGHFFPFNWCALAYTVPDDVIKRFSHQFNFEELLKYQKISESVLRECKDKISWEYVSEFYSLSWGFIEEFESKLYIESILNNKLCTHNLPVEFLVKHIDLIDNIEKFRDNLNPEDYKILETIVGINR